MLNEIVGKMTRALVGGEESTKVGLQFIRELKGLGGEVVAEWAWVRAAVTPNGIVVVNKHDTNTTVSLSLRETPEQIPDWLRAAFYSLTSFGHVRLVKEGKTIDEAVWS